MELFKLGLIVIFVGFALAFAATLVLTLTAIWGVGEVKVTGGGCVVIAFVPVCFGYGDPLLLAVLMAVAIVLVAVSYVFIREARKLTEKSGRIAESW